MKTLKFIWKSIYSNVVILEQEQKWWLAIIIFLVSIVASVGGTLYSGYTSNANGLLISTSETAVDVGWSAFASDINAKGMLYIEDGQMKIGDSFSSKYTVYTKETVDNDNNIYSPTLTYTHTNSDDTKSTVFKVYVFGGDFNPATKSEDNTFLSNFLKKSVYLYDTTTSANTWAPCSFMILTTNTVHAASYKVLGATATDSAKASISGVFSKMADMDFYTLGHSDTGTSLTNEKISSNTLSFINSAYTTIKISSAWYQTGIYTAMNVGIVIIAGLVFWLISRSKTSIIHYNLWQAEKITVFMSFTPGLITFVLSFFLSSYSSFVFLMIVALRIMSAVQRLSGSRPTDDKPVYKARS